MVEEEVTGPQRLPDNFLVCRTYGHAWAPQRVWRVKGTEEYLSQLTCARCASTRYQRMDWKGNLLGNAYQYADGYKKRKDEDRFTRTDARAEFLGRSLR